MYPFKVFKQILMKFKWPESYQDAEYLIKRAIMRFQERSKLDYPKCPFCGKEMKFRFSNLSRYGWPIREDQCWKCPNCYYTCTFGIPITRKEWDEEFKLRKGHVILRPDLREDEKWQKTVLEHLKKFGYLDF